MGSQCYNTDMTSNFYDKVAEKFGSYHAPSRRSTEFPNGSPEEIFKDKLISISGENKIVLDSGCADGRFTLSVAPFFKKIIAIDTSKGMLKSAKIFQREQKVPNVDFVYQNLHKITSKDEYDVIYNRRGPVDYPIFYKALKKNGFYIEIDIGEKDAMDIKKVFKRGQNYGEWDNSVLKRDSNQLEEAGFKIIFIRDYLYDEYYKTFEDLNIFLQGVPIFEDYDSQKDKSLLVKYANRFTSEKGINLLRHRVVMLAQK